MTTEKLEYGANLGGPITLPSHVSTYHYAAEALQEIKSLIADAQLPANSKLIFQTLPKHMRRRAMSHHPKRLPRKYRAAHKSQMGKAGNQPVNNKRPSRKYRRRPKNLMREYVRRQRKHSWLETHIWHAKRFHMIDRWGYRLPYASCDKTYRACYRASAEHCLLQDISFYRCVQLQGTVDQLYTGFMYLSSYYCGNSIAAKTFLNGRREGTIELFADYPFGALQRASFMWCADDTNEKEDVHTLWLWLHPAAAEATIAQIINIFKMKSTKQVKLQLPNEDSKEEPLRFFTYTKAFEPELHYNNDDNSIQMTMLNSLNRFRLTGPQAQRVLSASLRPYHLDSEKTTDTHWLAEMNMSQKMLEQHKAQADYCEAALQLDSPSQLLSNLIIGVNVVDPRLQRPKKRTKASKPAAKVTANKAAQLLKSQPAFLSSSALWQPELRERLNVGMLTTHTYNQLRDQHVVVPGERCAFEDKMQPVPLLLIQRPGSKKRNYKRIGYGSGWDIIVPQCYGLPLWQTLIMWGARPGGLREFDSVAREAGGEQNLPDTIVGLNQASLAATERRARYFRLPPNKRCNYRKLAVVSPFIAPWQQLVRDWCTSAPTSFYVLRQYDLLRRLDDCWKHWCRIPAELPEECLIQIQLRMLSRGLLKDNALICLPTSDDLKHRWTQLKRSDNSAVHIEPLVPDLNESLRKELRFKHKRQLKRLRAHRVREKRRLQETSARRVHIRPANTAVLVRDQLDKMCRLWLPIDPAETRDSVRRQCTREVFGYVNTAAFCFTEATVCGVGYVTSSGLRMLLETTGTMQDGKKGRPAICLVRNPDCRDYRFARFQVNLNVTDPPY